MHSIKKNIEELILDKLQFGTAIIIKLIESIRKDRPATTKQAVYSALRKLREAEKVLIHNGQVSLNIKWIQKMTQYFSSAQYHYIHRNVGDGNFVGLDEGEKIQYFFKNPVIADIFWTHALYILIELSDKHAPVFIYNPHEWFLIARKDNETAFIRDVKEKSRMLLVTVGGKTALDREVSKYFDGTSSQYYMSEKPLFQKRNYYINTIGDFIIEVWISSSTADEIEKVYKTTNSLSDTVGFKLAEILQRKGETKIVVSKNKKKAVRLQKMLGKNFYIPLRKVLG